ncbi:hypothetical protein N7495_004429 [Penicillium taxi]|uniref:uncharacterized protein n=1 Tax=Penicillium taxi TaxID=168475 RepID=UPI002545AC65|nr:uncharacterized protein N7495_004429 [Penicillium taxi]KAJ5899685.1 hypothetical protein N7495_004429 [Penicillium taxi]
MLDAMTPFHPSDVKQSFSTMSCLSTPDPRVSRPKLTLQTSSLPRTFGTSTTSLSLSFTAAPGASPTVRNTFKNAYDVASPSSATASPKGTSVHFNNSNNNNNNTRLISPYIPHPGQPKHNSLSNTNNTHRSSPYQLPLGVRSILRNSPLEIGPRRRSGSISAGASVPGTRRVFFPAKKQVSYRLPLEEEIRTERYTAHHLDLVHENEQEAEAVQQTKADARAGDPPADPADFENDSDAQSTSSGDDASADEDVSGSTLSKHERKKRRTVGIQRQVRAVALLDGFGAADPSYNNQTSFPQTPRVKRRREWKWTLGPIETEKVVENCPDSGYSDTPIQGIPTVDEPHVTDQ